MILIKENTVMMISFDKKIEDLLKGLKIERPKVAKYIVHIYADFIELNALFLKEETTISDISDLLTDVHDSNIVEPDIESLELIKSETNDRIEEKINDIFSLCMQRSNMYSDDEYPFDTSSKFIKLKPKLTDKHKFYLFLLISSNLNYFGSIQNVLSKEFELLSLQGLKSYLSPKAIIKSIGSYSDYTGNAIKKINDLASELGIKINRENVSCISKNNTKERGCDLIAWLPFKDKFPNMLILLCQCACGKDWESKQTETQLFSNYFYFSLTPIHCMFVPYALSNSNNTFYQNDRIANVLFFDRKRIIEQFANSDFFEQYESFKIVDKFIKTRVSIN